MVQLDDNDQMIKPLETIIHLVKAVPSADKVESNATRRSYVAAIIHTRVRLINSEADITIANWWRLQALNRLVFY